jgi:hypothetical protein
MTSNAIRSASAITACAAVSRTYLLSAEQAHRIEQVAHAMNLSESAVVSLVRH